MSTIISLLTSVLRQGQKIELLLAVESAKFPSV